MNLDEMRKVWLIADQAGFDHVWCSDHFASTIGTTGHVFDAWALQAAMAVTTRRVRLGCMVTGNTYRPPWLLAKLAVTVDHISGGRLEFGIGAAWNAVEHRMYDIPGLEQRVGRLRESLQVIKALWSQDRTTFLGRHYTLRNAVAEPKPVQTPHPPIWIGAGGEQTIRLAARHADVWSVSRAGMSHIPRLLAALRSACSQIRRDPSSIRLSVRVPWDGRDRSSVLAACQSYFEQGFTEQVLTLPADDAVRGADSLAELLPDLRNIPG